MRTQKVTENSGYLAISRDDSLLCVGAAKKDLVGVYETESGDLLINLTGGEPAGYFGKMSFLPPTKGAPDSNNAFMELRVAKIEKGRPKESKLRLWDLGFKVEKAEGGEENKGKGDDDDEESDDEVEEKLWETTVHGRCNYGVSGDVFLMVSEEDETIEWRNRADGAVTKTLKLDGWVSKPIVSSDGKYFAVARFAKCLIYSVASGKVVAEVKSPVLKEVYPVVPFGFFNNDRFLAVRINQERTIILSEWRSDTILTIKNIGGTISEGCVAISHDERFLVSWPFGYLEVYDLKRLVSNLTAKISSHYRIPLVKLRVLLTKNRATTTLKLLKDALTSSDDIFKQIISYL